MLKIIVSVLFIIIALIAGRLVFLSLTSKAPDAKLVNGTLQPCPQTPNSSSEKAWANLRAAIKLSGGVVRQHDDSYLWATYTSRVFRFVDDMEFRLLPEKKIIHVRSASRVGNSDLGINRKNVEKLRQIFNNISET